MLYGIYSAYHYNDTLVIGKLGENGLLNVIQFRYFVTLDTVNMTAVCSVFAFLHRAARRTWQRNENTNNSLIPNCTELRLPQYVVFVCEHR